MHARRPALRVVLLAAMLDLAACGANVVNGPGIDAAPLLASAPGQAAFVDYLQNAHHTTLNATSSGGDQYTIVLDAQPGAGTTVFNGAGPAYLSVDRLSLQLNGAFGGTLADIVTSNYFLLDPFVPLGQTYASGIPYGVITSAAPLPVTFEVGTSGAFYSLTYYHDATLGVVDGVETASYSVFAADSQTLRMCLNFELADVTLVGGSDGLVPGPKETDCYSVDALGTVTLISITLMVATNEMLTFT